MRATRLYIDTDKIRANISKISQYLGDDTQIMSIIKCDAYGTHLNKLIKVINNLKYVGVALVDEGVSLRKIGYKGNIFILYPPTKEELKVIQKYNLIFNGCDIKMLEDFDKKATKKLIIHTEIDTGMGRTGIQFENIYDYIKRLKKLKNIKLDGVFSHLSSSSSDIEFSKLQIDRFKESLYIFKKEKIAYNYAHICNSSAIFSFKDAMFNMVRVGLLIYGYYPNDRFKKLINLQPSMMFKTKINFIKEIEVGDTVGYNRNFIAQRKSIIATIPFGFGDGFVGLEALEPHNPYVIIKNKKAKIVGICMDNMMLDVTEIYDIKTGDEVIIFDNENLTVEEIGVWCNGICNYEVISTLSERIPRVFE